MKKYIFTLVLGGLIAVSGQLMIREILRSETVFAFLNSSPEAKMKKVLHVNPADHQFSKKFDGLSVKLHPGSSYRKDSKPNTQNLTKCKSLVYQTLKSLPESHAETLKDLTFYFTNDGRRGLGAKDKVILRCQNVSDFELSAVLVHEIGHLVDTGFFVGNSKDFASEFLDFENPVYEDDPSVAFYRISWENSEKTRDGSSPLDFISGYAETDPFEDFAETYAYYLLHGAEFRKLAKNNDRLFQKYTFMKDAVFEQEEFGKNSAVSGNFYTFYRIYDVTSLNFDLAAFFRKEF